MRPTPLLLAAVMLFTPAHGLASADEEVPPIPETVLDHGLPDTDVISPLTVTVDASVGGSTSCTNPSPGHATLRCTGHFTASASGTGLLVEVSYTARGTFSVDGHPSIQSRSLSDECAGTTQCSTGTSRADFQAVVVSSSGGQVCTTTHLDATTDATARNLIDVDQDRASLSLNRRYCS